MFPKKNCLKILFKEKLPTLIRETGFLISKDIHTQRSEKHTLDDFTSFHNNMISASIIHTIEPFMKVCKHIFHYRSINNMNLKEI